MQPVCSIGDRSRIQGFRHEKTAAIRCDIGAGADRGKNNQGSFCRQNGRTGGRSGFLLNRQSWEEISADITPQERYVLVYDFSNDPTIREHARQIARQLGARLYSLNDFAPLAYAERNISDAGPLEFLAWIKNAEFVISNSFHATAFSVLFHKPFLTYPLRGRTNHSRMRDFLNGLGMTDRFDPQQIQDTTPLSTPDWKRIDDLLSGKIDTSKSFLSHNTNS